MMNGFIREGVSFVLAVDQEFAIWSTKKTRTMIRVPAGTYVCSSMTEKHTFETVATFVQSAYMNHQPGDQVVFIDLIFESSYWRNSYCTGRQYCYLKPFAVGDEVIYTRTDRKHTVTSVHPPVFKIMNDKIHGWPEASYTLSGSSTRYWHHELTKG